MTSFSQPYPAMVAHGSVMCWLPPKIMQYPGVVLHGGRLLKTGFLARLTLFCGLDSGSTAFFKALAKRTLLKMMASLCKLWSFRTSNMPFNLFCHLLSTRVIAFVWMELADLPSPSINVFQSCDLVRRECAFLVLRPALHCKFIRFFVIS